MSAETATFWATPVKVSSATHLPFEHDSPLAHLVLQVPQLSGSVWVLISQPSACLSRLQSAKPVLQVPSQTPPEQLGVRCEVEQDLPHWPQLAASVSRLASQPSLRLSRLQSAKLALQAPLQPLLQVRVTMLFDEQMLLQPRQLSGSVAV